MSERITLLSSPPVVGRVYEVPTVHYEYDGSLRAWPVFLPKHEDQEHLNFPWLHYHVDPRFVDARAWKRLSSYGWGAARDDSEAYSQLQRAPLSRFTDDRKANIPHPPVVWKKLRCKRSEIPYQHGDKSSIMALRDHFSGAVCRTSRAGWLCPHKRFPLGSIAPDADGVITCPLHGLRIDARDGRVLPRTAAQLTPHQRPRA